MKTKSTPYDINVDDVEPLYPLFFFHMPRPTHAAEIFRLLETIREPSVITESIEDPSSSRGLRYFSIKQYGFVRVLQRVVLALNWFSAVAFDPCQRDSAQALITQGCCVYKPGGYLSATSAQSNVFCMVMNRPQ